MARILVLTCDLPYFPGKNGHDFFNLRHLARTHEVAVVAPCYEHAPAAGVANLEGFLRGSHFWPRPAKAVPLFISEDVLGWAPALLARLPAWLRRSLLLRLLHIHRAPSDAHEKLAILANCAPHLLAAIDSGHWHAVALIQTNLTPWLRYLPAGAGKSVYFHDVRADYLARHPASGVSKRQALAIREQEAEAVARADVVGFVSDLDRERAGRLFELGDKGGVAPIPVDTAYFVPRPQGTPAAEAPTVLFTGHLSHPPNIDAVLYFVHEIWPEVRKEMPAAVFLVAGMLPHERLKSALQSTPGCELHANVPDIRPYFWRAHAYVVPMRFGGGVRQKIFEAWSMQVPVVCTTMAAEGTGARGAEHCWIEDEPAAFASRVVGLLREAATPAVAAAAKRHVESSNSVAAAAPKFQALLERAFHVKRRRPFKVLHDLRWMEIGKAGGVEQATYELLSAIGQLDHRNEYRILAPRSASYEWDFPRGFRVERHFHDAVDRQLEAQHAFLSNRLAETLELPPVLTTPMRSLAAYRKMDFDLVHSVCSYTHPDLLAFPGVLTINDLQHLHHPQFFTAHEHAEREKLYRESARRARHIICISEYTRQDVHRQYGIPLEKMSTVWIIPSRNVWAEIPPVQRDAVLRGMGIDGPFMFYPAQSWPHKNHARLVETFQLIAPHLPPELKLVLTGRPFAPDHPVTAMIRDLGLAGRIVHLGYRSPLEIRALFQGCLLLVFPSLFEGFGMPVAEAIIAGKPVACSNCTSLPEIAGAAALTFDPTNIHDIGGRILEIVNDPARREALAHEARTRRTVFSSRVSAVQTLAVYQRVYDELYRF